MKRIKSKDFRSVRPDIGEGEPHLSGTWEVYESYTLEGPKDDSYIVAKGSVKRTYRPLVDEPDLFMDLARLGSFSIGRSTSESDGYLAYEELWPWLHRYGALGISYGGDDAYYPASPRFIRFRPPTMYDTDGGPDDTLGYVEQYAEDACLLLHLYEACLNRNAARLENLLGGPSAVAPEVKLQINHENILNHVEYVDVLINMAMRRIWHELSTELSKYAYPSINHELPAKESVPHLHTEGLLSATSLGASWGFRNLVGAAYLQFYWLVTSRADIKRCKFCGRLISLAAPVLADGSTGRKPRSNKEYCSKSCRQSADYHRRGKWERKKG